MPATTTVTASDRQAIQKQIRTLRRGFSRAGSLLMPSTIELDQADATVGGAADSVRCIRAADLLTGDRLYVAGAVRAACLETGFFCIDITPAESAAVAATLLQMRRFFSLENSDRRKQDVRQNEDGTGWVPQYAEPAYQPGTISSLEAFDCDLASTAAQWPRIPGFRRDVTRCWAVFDALGEAILEFLARAARIDAGFFVERCRSKTLNKMRLLHYAGAAPSLDDRFVGIAAHTDFECISLLYQTAPGLELRNVQGQWLEIPAHEGRIVVLLGDMLERWTNGFFKATGHRVQNTDERRFSIVMFLAANDDIEIAPLANFVSTERPASYEPVRQSEHIASELKRSMDNARRTAFEEPEVASVSS